jgi:very-short-patch-repair endonuclease
MTKIADIAKASQSKSFRDLNPGFFKATHSELAREEALEAVNRLISNPRKELPHPGSALATKFLNLWTQLGGPTLNYEYRFHPIRKWRFDFALPESKIAIEINGGIWNYGRHNRASGYIKDLEKMNEAQMMAWRVFQLHNATITAPNVNRIIELTKK